MAHKKDSFVKCTVCGAILKPANLLQHNAKLHVGLLSEEEKALLRPEKPALREKELPESFAAWHARSKDRYLNEKRLLNGTIEASIWSCITSALFEAARETDLQKIQGYNAHGFESGILKLLDRFRDASRNKLKTVSEKKDRAQMRENIEVAKCAIELIKSLPLREICIGVTCYLDRDILYPDGIETAYRKAILINPYNAAARGNLASLLESEGRPLEAEREYGNLRKYG